MEELRGQLTEAGIPAVWQIAAKAMGKTSEELDKAITRREIKSADLIEALAEALRELAAPGVAEGKKTITPTISRFSNVWNQMSDILYQGFLPAFKGIINIAADLIQALMPLWRGLQIIGRLIGFLVGGFRIFTAIITDMINNREKFFRWVSEGMPGLKSAKEFKQERLAAEKAAEESKNKTTLDLTDDAKRLLEVKQEEVISKLFERSINSGVTN